MWQNATEANCINFSPEQCGWLWFEGDPTPLLVEDIVMVELDEVELNEIDNCDDDSYDNDDYNKKNDSDHDDNNDDNHENKGDHDDNYDKSDDDHGRSDNDHDDKQCGWLWFEGDPTPLLVEDIVMVELDEVELNEIDNCDDDSYDNDDYNKKNDSDHDDNNDDNHENKGDHDDNYDKSDDDHGRSDNDHDDTSSWTISDILLQIQSISFRSISPLYYSPQCGQTSKIMSDAVSAIRRKELRHTPFPSAGNISQYTCASVDVVLFVEFLPKRCNSNVTNFNTRFVTETLEKGLTKIVEKYNFKDDLSIRMRFGELLAIMLLFLQYCIAPHTDIKPLQYLSIAFLWNESFKDMVDFSEGNKKAVILGENGSGKTTLVSLITGVIKPSRGNCYLKFADTRCKKDMEYFRRQIGVCHQYNNIRNYNDLTVMQHMILFTCLRGFRKDFAMRDSIMLLNDFEVAHVANRYYNELSKDVVRRVNLALAFTGETTVVILDDPTYEIDPSARRSIWKTLKNMKKERCIILCTRSVQEAEYCSDRLAILNNGTIRCHGTTDFIKKRFGIGNHLVVTQSGNYDQISLKNFLKEIFPQDEELFSENKYVVKYTLRNHKTEYNDYILELMENNASKFDIINCKIAMWSLEDIIMSLSIMWLVTLIFPDLFMDPKDIGMLLFLTVKYLKDTNKAKKHLPAGLFHVYVYERTLKIVNYNLILVVHYMLIILPPYAFMNMFYQLNKQYEIYELCYVISKNNNTSAEYNDASIFLNCKEMSKYPPERTWDTDIYISTAMLFIEGVIFWMLFYTIEELHGRLNRFSRFGLFVEPIKTFVHPTHYTVNKNVQHYNIWNLNCSRPQIWTHPVFVRDVSKTFRHGKLQVLNHLFFSIREGECFGLIGRNGEGKSTAFKILVGELMLINGNAWVCGYNVKTQINKIHSKIGYCPQLDALYNLFTVYSILKFFCLIRGHRKYYKEIIEIISQQLDLKNELFKRIHTLNSGNKRKVSIAIAILGDPQVIILDEPTTGVGVVARRHIWHVLNSLRRKGKTLIVTTENMRDCEMLCTNVGILKHGSMAFIGSIRKLKRKYSGTFIVYLTIERYVVDIDNLLETIRTTVMKSFFEPNFSMKLLSRESRRYMKYRVRGDGLQWNIIHKYFRTHKKILHLRNFSVSEISLEEIYLEIVNS
ncbi:ATP-binding cassette sub-family A member 10-like [Chrysoperla carnea]|uniref:ATP-binding cassette sub-family A member 10-like n=1 Tax=Chrysoperla carnea TaxID=189513 RepID=UPI001D09147C|nr:ATP-binding cassette sub-family A member 10-like [Chrysoperla carnea]